MRPTLCLIALAAAACAPKEVPKDHAKEPVSMSSRKTYTKPSPEDLKKQLSYLEYRVTQESGTEPPFTGKYWDHHEAGIYVDITTGEPLFSSLDKFDSGTGWPSFTKPIEDGRVVEHGDETHGMVRTEVRSKAGDAHLGHVFDDGPRPTGLRYCINSASLRFVPAARLAAEGYGDYAARFGTGATPPGADHDNACAVGDKPQPGQPGCETNMEVAILAGGCFWGMEDLLRKIPGVLDTEVGYAGGKTDKPTYKDVSTGRTGHAESVRIVFDPTKLTYAQLLEQWFFRMHDPTTKNQQGNDIGSQYRSAIFTTSDEQQRVAEEVKAKVERSGKWKKPIVTEITKAGPFTPAEDYHQDYLVENPGGYTCHWLRDFEL